MKNKIQSLLKESIKSGPKWIGDKTIFASLHGSWAYGLNTETSDFDVRGVCIPPKEVYLAFSQNFDQFQCHNKEKEFDLVIFGLSKFFMLAAKNNPNVIELLYIDPKFWIKSSKPWEILVENRDLFLSQLAYESFSGYAVSQLKRIKTHRSWILNPADKRPERKDYGLEGEKKLTASEVGALSKLEKSGQIDIHILELFNREKKYLADLQNWQNYQNWKKARNPDRAKMEAKYGFDCKHASHLIRLTLMAKEILRDKKIEVYRPDRQYLLDVKHGKYSYEEVVEMAEKNFQEMDELLKKTDLPRRPSFEKLEKLHLELLEESFKNKVL